MRLSVIKVVERDNNAQQIYALYAMHSIRVLYENKIEK